MRIFITLLAFSSFFLSSCQKEIDPSIINGGGGGGGSTSTLLVKIVTKTGSDSSVQEFSYNSSGRIIGYKLSGVQSGQPIDFSLSYVRNGSSVIQKQILKSNDLVAIGVDSIVTVVNYDVGNNRYKSGVSVFVLLGLSIRDSIAFQYDGTGRLASEIDYTDVGSGMIPSTKTEYSYAGNNLAGEKIYSYDTNGSTFQLENTYTYEYDSKINPLQFATEGAVLNMNPFYSANNITRTTLVASDPADNYVSVETFTYTLSNRPATSTSVTGSDTSTTTYYYQ